jgi:hypothetical protein
MASARVAHHAAHSIAANGKTQRRVSIPVSVPFRSPASSFLTMHAHAKHHRNLEHGDILSDPGDIWLRKLSIRSEGLFSQSRGRSWSLSTLPPYRSHLPVPKQITHLTVRPCPVPLHFGQRPVPWQSAHLRPAVRKSVRATSPGSVYSQRCPATCGSGPANSSSVARPSQARLSASWAR